MANNSYDARKAETGYSPIPLQELGLVSALEPASDVDPNVTKEDMMNALLTHCRNSRDMCIREGIVFK